MREALARCRLSIHLVGRTYSLVPEGGRSSLIEMQNELAIARSAGGGFSRLVWIPPGLQVDDDRQKKVLDNLRMDPRTERAADVLETPLQDLRTLITAWLKPVVPSAPAPSAQTPAASTLPQVYLIYDQRDTAQMSVWSDFLFKQGCEVLRPIFEGDETDIRSTTRRTCARLTAS